MTFDELSRFLADWYETDADALGLCETNVPQSLNPILREFYIRFGALAASKSPFGHPKSRYGPLSAQDHIVPGDELDLSGDPVPFIHENQGVFVAAAKVDHPNTHVQGDVGADRFDEFTPTEVPLQETLVSASLMETVMSVQDRDRLVTPALTKRRRQALRGTTPLRLRTVFSGDPWSYHLTAEVIGFGFGDEPEFFATRGQWRLVPPRFQTVKAEGGGGWSSGPAHLTFSDRIQKWATYWVAARKIGQ